jgi:uncharacterized repeat protein (TIGR03803 family)
MRPNPRLAAISNLFFTIIALMLITHVAAAQTKFKVLYSFTGGKDGGGSWDNVAVDKQGNLYGTTSGGGDYHYGVVYELMPGAKGKWTESVLHSFGTGAPRDTHRRASSYLMPWAIYMAQHRRGGKNHAGTVFEMAPGTTGWTITVLYAFCALPNCSDGGGPKSGVIFDKAGNLYGTAGGVFELSPGSGGWTESILYPFCLDPNCNLENGSNPLGGLIFDSLGNLYGTTLYGGDLSCLAGNGCGTVYELTPSGGIWNERVLHAFGSMTNDGEQPILEQLVLDQTGNLYGTTQYGGSHICGETGCGTVFELSPDGNGQWTETILYDFSSGANGNAPAGGLVLDVMGNLYGVTGLGGAPLCECGVAYKLTPGSGGTWTYSVLHTFTGPDGVGPSDGLTSDGKGHLFGTTYSGGRGGAGVVYELVP